MRNYFFSSVRPCSFWFQYLFPFLLHYDYGKLPADCFAGEAAAGLSVSSLLTYPALYFLQSNSHLPLHAPGYPFLSPPFIIPLSFLLILIHSLYHSPLQNKAAPSSPGGLSSRASSCVNSSHPRANPASTVPSANPMAASPGTSLPQRPPPCTQRPQTAAGQLVLSCVGRRGPSPRLADGSLDNFPPGALGHRGKQSTGICLLGVDAFTFISIIY